MRAVTQQRQGPRRPEPAAPDRATHATGAPAEHLGAANDRHRQTAFPAVAHRPARPPSRRDLDVPRTALQPIPQTHHPQSRPESHDTSRGHTVVARPIGAGPDEAQYWPLITKYEPRMVPASFDFCRANLNREASSSGTSIPSESLNPTARFSDASTPYITLIDRPLS